MEHRIIKNICLILFVVFAVSLNACYYDVEEELYAASDCDSTNVRYSVEITEILTNNGCLTCHSDLATLDLNGYADLKVYVDNGALLGSLNHDPAYRPMPDNSPKISACDLNRIEKWVREGALDN